MMDFLTQNALYVVLACATIIWLGIALYLSVLNRRIDELETRLKR